MSTTRRCAETTPTTLLWKSKMVPPQKATISCHGSDGSPRAFSTLVVARAMACALPILPSDSKAAYTNKRNVSNLYIYESSERISPRRGRIEYYEQYIHRQHRWRHLRPWPIMLSLHCHMKAAGPVVYHSFIMRLSTIQRHIETPTFAVGPKYRGKAWTG
jgi:hypothetical protein